MTPRDAFLSKRIDRHSGSTYGRIIVTEARRAGLPISLACALVEQESGFRNVFGHDPTAALPRRLMGQRVTRLRYMRYRRRRRRGLGMQGVGLTQLTWFEFQNEADRLGGCHKPTYQCRVAFRLLATLVSEHGPTSGIERYNGTGVAAERYGRQVQAKQHRWHLRLA